MAKAQGNRFSELIDPFRGTMSRNWVLKLVCLGLAFVVWQGVQDSTSFEVVIADVPVRISAGDGHAVLNQSTDVVSIRFRGAREELRFINREQLTVELDLSDRTHRLRRVVRLAPRHVRAPSRAHAVEFYPEQVVVTLDREVERVVPVKATLEGDLPDGIQLEKAVCSPATVRVRGAEQRLLELEQLRTEPVQLDGRYGSFDTYVAVAANGQPWRVNPERVSVSLELVERVANRTFEAVPVRALLGSDDDRTVQIFPELVNITLKGSPERLDELGTKDVYGYIDCAELTEPADYEVPVRVSLPWGIRVEKIEPSVVQATIRKK
jgi:YbbR domain-containing protein